MLTQPPSPLPPLVRPPAFEDACHAFWGSLRGSPGFVCVIASTDTAEIPGRIATATTRWVARDPAADLPGILEHLPAPIPAVAAQIDFAGSSIPGLRRYEQGLVEEGAAAGAASAVAGGSRGHQLREIDEVVRAIAPA